jgi:acyl-CoA synthetase (AMP-forming)/AMP-acid ligase II
MNVRQLLDQNASRYADKPAVIFNDQPVTFSALKHEVLAMADLLRRQGVSSGDKVGIYLPNCPEYVYAYLACFCLGAVGVPLDYMLKDDELITCLDHAEAKMLIARDKAAVSLQQIQSDVPSLRTIMDIQSEAYASLRAEASAEISPVDVPESAPALIMYTSGTTGKPKGIQLSYKHLDGSPAAMHHFVDLTDKDVKLCPLPLSHIGGLIYIQNCILFGITLVLMDRFNPFKFLENVTRYKVTCFHIVPPMYNAILTLKQIENFDLSSLRWVVVFGAPSSPEILKRFHKYCPHAKFLNGWGMTETCPPNTVTPMDSDNIASVGKPSPHCDIQIVDDDDQPVPAGDIGEITISGWIVMDGYYKDPEATARMKKNGRLYTGDLGRFDENGFLYIVGRKKEMIKVGGQIVYAPEVESALYKHEAIAETAVIGIPDSMKGEAVKAFVVLKPDVELPAEDIRYFARQHLANFKVPSEIELRDALPKNRTGKIDKAVLKEEGARQA